MKKNTLLLLALLLVTFVQAQPPKDLKLSESEIQLFYAIQQSDTTLFDSLLLDGVNPNVEYFEQISVLGYAAGRGDIYFMNELIEAGADVNGLTKKGLFKYVPAVLAIKYKRNEALELLLNKGANVTITMPDMGGFTFGTSSGEASPLSKDFSLLLFATLHGNTGAVELILEKNPPIDLLSSGVEGMSVYGFSPILAASKFGYSDIVTLLLENGATPAKFSADAFGKRWFNALMLATNSDDTTTLRAILNTGLDINTKSDDGSTALSHASRQANIQSVAFLLENGADPTIVDSYGNTCIQSNIGFHIFYRDFEMNRLSNHEGEQMQLAGMFRSARNRWEKPDSLEFITPIEIELLEKEMFTILLRPWIEQINLKSAADASFQEYKERSLAVVNLLASTTVDINNKNDQQKTAVEMAADQELYELMGVLIREGASPLGAPANQLMRLAIHQSDIATFNQLVSQYLSTLSTQDKGFLMNLAVAKKDVRFVESLKNANVPLNIADEFGVSPLQVAAYYGEVELIQALLDLGADKGYSEGEYVKPHSIARFMQNTEAVAILIPDELSIETNFESAKSTAVIEGIILIAEGSVKSAEIFNYFKPISAALTDSFVYLRDPMVNWLSQSFNEEAKVKYASALYGHTPLVINGDGNSLAHFEKAQDYTSFPSIQYSSKVNFRNGTNNSSSISSVGPVKYSKKEDREDSHDAATWIGFEVAGETSWYGNSMFSAWAGTYVGACGGWDNKCVMVVNGDCISFLDAEPRDSYTELEIKGDITIPGVTKAGQYYAAYPKMTIYNEAEAVPLTVKQGATETKINAGEVRHFDRQYGDIKIISKWKDKAEASGSGCDENLKNSAFTVKFPFTEDATLLGRTSESSDRMLNYNRILSHRTYLNQHASELESYQIYAFESFIHILSEKCRVKFKPVIKAELNAVVDFFENTDFQNFNDALILLAESEQLEIPEVETTIDNLLENTNLDSALEQELLTIQSNLENLSIDGVRENLNAYKKHYMEIFEEKKALYNLLLLEYSMYISNEQLIETLALERVTLFPQYFNPAAQERFEQ